MLKLHCLATHLDFCCIMHRKMLTLTRTFCITAVTSLILLSILSFVGLLPEYDLEVLKAEMLYLQCYSRCFVVVRLQAAVSVPLLLCQKQVVVVWGGLGIQGRSC